MRTLFLLMFIFPTLFGCLQQDQNLVIDIGDGTASIEKVNLFDGISAVENVLDTTAIVRWAYSSVIHSYIIYEASDINNLVVLGVADNSSSAFKVTNLQPNSSYTFLVRAIFSSTLSVLAEDNNTNTIQVTTAAAPNIPQAVTLVSPTYSYGTEDSPVVRVYGTKAGDIVKVYSDSSCTVELSTTVAASNTTYTDVQIFNLPLGEYTFYANLSNGTFLSDCSEYAAKYEVSKCPYNYLLVGANSAVNQNSLFCVSKYEMKCSDQEGTACLNSEQPVAAPDKKPWVNISLNDAKIACQSLGANYKLITNSEWMAVAREIESNVFNWKDAKIPNFDNLSPSYNPNAIINRGHSNNYPSTALAASNDDNEACYGLINVNSNDCNGVTWHINKRTHNMVDEKMIWDIAGNVWEWVDLVSSDKPNDNLTWLDLKDVTPTVGIPANYFMPNEPQLTAQKNSIGIYLGASNSYASGARRGGNKDHGIGAGIYTLVMRESPSEFSQEIGFRCTYTVNP